jgi:hypothetical protein
MDPPARDSAHPAQMAELAFESAGERLKGLFYLPAGSGPHPVVVLLDAIEDVHAALRFVRSPFAEEQYRVDSARVALVGPALVAEVKANAERWDVLACAPRSGSGACSSLARLIEASRTELEKHRWPGANAIAARSDLKSTPTSLTFSCATAPSVAGPREAMASQSFSS